MIMFVRTVVFRIVKDADGASRVMFVLIIDVRVAL